MENVEKWNIQNMKNHIYDMAVQGHVSLFTCVFFIHISRANSNFKIKYTRNGKIKNK